VRVRRSCAREKNEKGTAATVPSSVLATDAVSDRARLLLRRSLTLRALGASGFFVGLHLGALFGSEELPHLFVRGFMNGAELGLFLRVG
jgi:hypothetical protein